MKQSPLENIRKIEPRDFPELLKQIPDPPRLLYTCGNTDLLHTSELGGADQVHYICIVGSRRYTRYGENICKTLIQGLAGLPVIIVSGLALGIDAIAHRAALDAGIMTIAVPGSGLHPDVLYPRSHFMLAEEIVEKGGLLLSEYEPMTRASPWSFPMRNRIMAGMSHAVLIIEAENDSGTLITARLGLDYNRNIGAVPGSILSENSSGTNNLIKKGATVITSVEDLKEFLGFPTEDNVEGADSSGRPTRKRNKWEVNPYENCSSEELTLLELMYEPQTRDSLLGLSGLPLSQLQVVLSMLELRGLTNEAYGQVALRYPPPSAILRKT